MPAFSVDQARQSRRGTFQRALRHQGRNLHLWNEPRSPVGRFAFPDRETLSPALSGEIKFALVRAARRSRPCAAGASTFSNPPSTSPNPDKTEPDGHDTPRAVFGSPFFESSGGSPEYEGKDPQRGMMGRCKPCAVYLRDLDKGHHPRCIPSFAL